MGEQMRPSLLLRVGPRVVIAWPGCADAPIHTSPGVRPETGQGQGEAGQRQPPDAARNRLRLMARGTDEAIKRVGAGRGIKAHRGVQAGRAGSVARSGHVQDNPPGFFFLGHDDYSDIRYV